MPYTLPWKDYSYSTDSLIQLLHFCRLKDNRLSKFQPEATSHQQKLWFDTFALCFWLLRDTAVLGSSWHLAPAHSASDCKAPQGCTLRRAENSEFQWATLQGQNPSSTTLVAHETCCLFTSGLDYVQPLCQGYSCLPSPQNFSPCRSTDRSQFESLQHNHAQLFFLSDTCVPGWKLLHHHFMQLNGSSAANYWVSAVVVGLSDGYSLYSFNPLGWKEL